MTIDVYVPPNVEDGVKVWQYGGFNEVGGTTYPLYDGCHLATDSIAVAFSYHVGPLGFFALESAGIKGNMAIHDALAALQWVQTNIASFGGNKSQVVLFGQSSGGDDTFVISTLPQAKRLISAAIVELGGGQFVTPYNVAQEVGVGYAATLNCSVKDVSQDLFAYIRRLFLLNDKFCWLADDIRRLPAHMPAISIVR